MGQRQFLQIPSKSEVLICRETSFPILWTRGRQGNLGGKAQNFKPQKQKGLGEPQRVLAKKAPFLDKKGGFGPGLNFLGVGPLFWGGGNHSGKNSQKRKLPSFWAGLKKSAPKKFSPGGEKISTPGGEGGSYKSAWGEDQPPRRKTLF